MCDLKIRKRFVPNSPISIMAANTTSTRPRCDKSSASFRNRLKKEIRVLREEQMKCIDQKKPVRRMLHSTLRYHGSSFLPRSLHDRTDLAEELGNEIKRKEHEWLARTVGLDEMLEPDDGAQKQPVMHTEHFYHAALRRWPGSSLARTRLLQFQ